MLVNHIPNATPAPRPRTDTPATQSRTDTATPTSLFHQTEIPTEQREPTPEELGYTPFMITATCDDLPKCEWFLRQVSKPEDILKLTTARNRAGQTTFLIAVTYGSLRICKLFLLNKLVNRPELEIALRIAVEAGLYPEICELLMHYHGVERELLKPHNETLLMLASRNRSAKICQIVMKAYPKGKCRLDYIQTKNELSESALFIAFQLSNHSAFYTIWSELQSLKKSGLPVQPEVEFKRDNPQLFELLIHPDPTNIVVRGVPVLHLMVLHNNKPATIALLNAGANPNAEDIHGNTPLYCAASKGLIDIYDILSLAGATLSLSNKTDSTLILEAAANGHLDLVQRLIRDGTPLDGCNEAGQCALLISLQKVKNQTEADRKKAYLDIAETLLAEGANPNLPDARQRTALLVAWEHGHWDFFHRLLKEFHAHPNVHGGESLKEGENYTLLGSILARGGTQPSGYPCFDALLTAGANPNGNAHLINETPLTFCAQRTDRIPFLQRLLKAGANCNEKNKEEETPLLLAVKKTRPEACAALLDAHAELDIKDKQHKTALFYAAKIVCEKPPERLLRERDDMDFQEQNAVNICRALLASGAAVYASDRDIASIIARSDMAEPLRLGLIVRAERLCRLPDTSHQDPLTRLKGYPAARRALKQYLESLLREDRANPLLYLPPDDDSSCLIC